MASQDLLSQISAADKVEVAPKRQQSIFMMLLVRLMRLMLQFDEVRRKNPRFFKTVHWVWGILMATLYLGGITALSILIYSYMRFPEFIRDYFQRSQIAVQDLKIDDYDFSKIEIHDLSDSSGTYTIKNVTIYSSFSDFLRRRVKSVVIDGVSVKIKETKDGLDFGNLPQVLTRLNQDGGPGNVHINTLSVMNAQIEFEGQKLKLPITFSLTGAYDNGTKLTLPFSVKQEDIKLVGALSVSGTARDMEWTLDVTSGTLSLPDSYPENITGNLVFKTQQMRLTGVLGSMRLSYGKNVKEFQVELNKVENEFIGNVRADIVNQNMGENSNVKTTADLFFSGLQIPSLSQVSTTKPIHLNIQSFARENIVLSDLTGEIKGNLSCDGFACSYHLSDAAHLSLRSFKYTGNNVTIESSKPVKFSIAATKAEEPFISYKNNRIAGTGAFQSIVFDGFFNGRENPFTLMMAHAEFSGQYDGWKHEKKLSLRIFGTTYDMPDQKVIEGAFNTPDIFAEKPVVRVGAQRVILKKNPLIMAPFKFSSEQVGSDTKGLMEFEDGKIKVALNGKMWLRTGEFVGEIFVHPFNLADVSQPLSDMSGFFPDSIQNVAGTMGVFGNLNWKNTKQISGPLFVVFKDVSFDTTNLKVNGVNTVLLLQSLSPFVTAAPQNVFVSEIMGPFRFQNVAAQVKLESQLMRITSLQGQIGALELRMDPIILPYKTENITMYLRNNAFDFDAINAAMKDDTLKLAGHGAITVPVRFDKGFFSVRNGEFKISNGDVIYNGDNKTVKKNIFQDVSKIYVQSGNGTFSSVGDEDTYSLFLNLDIREPDTNKKLRIKETVTGALNNWLKPVPTAPIPSVIATKQAVVIK